MREKRKTPAGETSPASVHPRMLLSYPVENDVVPLAGRRAQVNQRRRPTEKLPDKLPCPGVFVVTESSGQKPEP